MPAAPAEPLFGRLVVDLKLASAEQVHAALEHQGRLREAGRREWLGALLEERGVISSADVRQVLELQGKVVMACAACGATSNAPVVENEPPAPCHECGGPRYVPGTRKAVREHLEGARTRLYRRSGGSGRAGR